MRLTALPRSYYDRGPDEVAPDLLGMLLVRKSAGRLLIGRIVETEAYLPANDPAAHSFKGKTARTVSLYKEGGHAYVHRMRQYCLLDIVTGSPDEAGSVLIRAIEPIEGMKESIDNLADGPGKVCLALGITHSLDGIDMTKSSGKLFVVEGNKGLRDQDRIVSSPRVGISKAKHLELRFRLLG